MKTLILFAYNDRSDLFTANLQYFLRNGVFESTECDFCIIVSGPSSQKFEEKGNLRVLRRANEKGDFGAWGYALDKFGTDYDYFIFINDTARGPYIPGWSPRAEWVRYFTMQLDNQCKLVGPTKNVMFGEHVQSYAFAVDKQTLEVLLKARIFHPTLNYPAQKMDFIIAHEVGMSKLLLGLGYQIKEFYNGRGLTPYVGRETLSPFEVMFVKTNAMMRFDPRQLAVDSGQSPPPARVRWAATTVEDRLLGKNMTSVKRSQLQRK